MKPLFLFCFTVLFGAFAQGVHAQMMAGAKPGQVIVEELRKGGFVLFMRHTHADVGDDTMTEAAHLADCSKQRRLSDKGRATAVNVGETMRTLKIPVARVYTGELCRARETGELLGYGTIEPLGELNDPALWRIKGQDPGGFKARNEALLATPPSAGSNTVLVSHMQKGSIAVSPMLDLIEPGTIAVFKPGGGKSELIAIIRAADWPHLGVSELPLR